MTARIHSLAAHRDSIHRQVRPETQHTVSAPADRVEVEWRFPDGMKVTDFFEPEAAREFAALLIEAADDAEARTR